MTCQAGLGLDSRLPVYSSEVASFGYTHHLDQLEARIERILSRRWSIYAPIGRPSLWPALACCCSDPVWPNQVKSRLHVFRRSSPLDLIWWIHLKLYILIGRALIFKFTPRQGPKTTYNFRVKILLNSAPTQGKLGWDGINFSNATSPFLSGIL